MYVHLTRSFLHLVFSSVLSNLLKSLLLVCNKLIVFYVINYPGTLGIEIVLADEAGAWTCDERPMLLQNLLFQVDVTVWPAVLMFKCHRLIDSPPPSVLHLGDLFNLRQVAQVSSLGH